MNGSPPKVITLYPMEHDEPHPSSLPVAAASRGPQSPDEQETPVDLYSVAQIERLLGISASQLRRWDRAGLVSPTSRRRGQRRYSFKDLVGLRVIADLLKGGRSPLQLSRALRALKCRLPHRSSLLTELRLSREGEAIVVREDDKRFEAETGQLLLDFDASELHRQVVELVQPRPRPGDEQRRRAFEHYIEGCQLEARPENHELAEQAYRKALELDPRLASAYTNLGNLRYRSGATDDARALYTKAVELEPEQPEAQYNLAFLSYEDGELVEAVRLFRRAIELDPDFADAHFNLAMALTELVREKEAAFHFRAYLALEPTGSWAEFARQELGHQE